MITAVVISFLLIGVGVACWGIAKLLELFRPRPPH